MACIFEFSYKGNAVLNISWAPGASYGNVTELNGRVDDNATVLGKTSFSSLTGRDSELFIAET